RRNVMVVDETTRPFSRDLHQLPMLVVDFLLVVPRLMIRWIGLSPRTVWSAFLHSQASRDYDAQNLVPGGGADGGDVAPVGRGGASARTQGRSRSGLRWAVSRRAGGPLHIVHARHGRHGNLFQQNSQS